MKITLNRDEQDHCIVGKQNS